MSLLYSKPTKGFSTTQSPSHGLQSWTWSLPGPALLHPTLCVSPYLLSLSPYSLCALTHISLIVPLLTASSPSRAGCYTSFRYPVHFFRSLLWSPYLKAYCPRQYSALTFFILFFTDINPSPTGTYFKRTRTLFCSMMDPQYLEQSNRRQVFNKCLL